MVLRISKFSALILSVTLLIGGFIGCDALKKNPVEAKYETLPYENCVFRKFYYTNAGKAEQVNLSFDDSDLILLSTYDEYKAANIYDLARSEDFFEENALLVMQYTHSSSDEPIELVDIAIKDGKLYPVVSMELLRGQNICMDNRYTYIIADVKKSDVENYSFGEVLALNLADETYGSVFHERFE